MKNKFSAQLKIVVLSMFAVLALLTFFVFSQTFNKKAENITFVYNSSLPVYTADVNILDIL